MDKESMTGTQSREQSPIEIQLTDLMSNIETLERRLDCIREPGSSLVDKPSNAPPPPPSSNSPVYQCLNEANARLRNLRDTLQI